MKALRSAINGLLRWGLPGFDEASDETLQRLYRTFAWVLAAAGGPPRGDIDPHTMKKYIGIVARAVLETPPGEPLRFPCPLVVTLSASDFCPFACANCYANSGFGARADREAIDLEVFRSVARSGTPFVVITGGEPLANRDLGKGLAILLDAGVTVYVSTNASLAGYLDLAAERRTSLFFVLPVWGERAAHDQLRGKGSFDRLEANLKLLNERGVRGRLLLVLADATLSGLAEVKRLAQAHDVEEVRINRKVRVGRSDGSSAAPSLELVKRLESELSDLRRHVPWVILDIPEMRLEPRKRRADWLDIGRNESCAAGSWMMHVDHRGAAYPCFTFEDSDRAPAVGAALGFDAQWNGVQTQRASLGLGDICVGEAHYRRAGYE